MIYLDNAATSYPKPAAVIEAVGTYMRECGGNPGRGGYKSALDAAATVYDCRKALAEMFDASGPDRVFFTMNTTQGLNFCIKGLMRRGGQLLISDVEHNAVWRPAMRQAERMRACVEIFPSLLNDETRSPQRICNEIAKRVRRDTQLLICTGASNLCSMMMPLTEIGGLCRSLGIAFVVDGAQLAGHGRISVRDMRIDALCLPAHKGLLGPQGCGAVILGDRLRLDTLIEGG